MQAAAHQAPGSSLLRNRIFQRVYGSYAISSFGDWFDALAIQALAGYRWNADPIWLAMIPVTLAVPGIALGSLAGVAADRVNKIRLMQICDFLTALLTVFVPFVSGMQGLLPLLFLRAALSSVHAPAQQALTRQLVREDQLLQASSLNGLVNQGSKIAGPLLGGTALLLLTPEFCIWLNAGARLVSLLLLMGLSKFGSARLKAEGETDGEGELPFLQMWKEGWSYLMTNRTLISTLLFGLMGSILIQLVDFQFTSLFRFLAPDKAYYLGWMVAATGIGAVLTLLWLGKWKGKAGYGVRLGTGTLAIAGGLAGLGMLPQEPLVLTILLLGFVIGLGNGLMMNTYQYCLQKETPPVMTGRIFGISGTLTSAVMVISPLLGGAWVSAAGPGRVFMACGGVLALLGAAGILLGRYLWPAPAVGPAASSGETGRPAEGAVQTRSSP